MDWLIRLGIAGDQWRLPECREQVRLNPANGPAAAFLSGITALGHYGTPEDIAATVVHLASHNSRYITGTVITVDCGFAA